MMSEKEFKKKVLKGLNEVRKDFFKYFGIKNRYGLNVKSFKILNKGIDNHSSPGMRVNMIIHGKRFKVLDTRKVSILLEWYNGGGTCISIDIAMQHMCNSGRHEIAELAYFLVRNDEELFEEHKTEILKHLVLSEFFGEFFRYDLYKHTIFGFSEKPNILVNICYIESEELANDYITFAKKKQYAKLPEPLRKIALGISSSGFEKIIKNAIQEAKSDRYLQARKLITKIGTYVKKTAKTQAHGFAIQKKILNKLLFMDYFPTEPWQKILKRAISQVELETALERR